MRVACEHCSKVLNIPDQKIPDTSRFKIRCPYCQKKTLVDLDTNQVEEKQVDPEVAQEISSNFKSLEPDIFPPGAAVVFLYLQDKEWREECKHYFESRGYYISSVETSEQAVQKLRLNTYELICIEDSNENESLSQEIAKWSGKQRANINFIMVGDRANSFDPTKSFVRGVDTYLNIGDQKQKQDLLDQALEGFKLKYEPWKIAEEEES